MCSFNHTDLLRISQPSFRLATKELALPVFLYPYGFARTETLFSSWLLMLAYRQIYFIIVFCFYQDISLPVFVIKDRSWTCLEYNIYYDRDINAAINILNEGLRILTICSRKITFHLQGLALLISNSHHLHLQN